MVDLVAGVYYLAGAGAGIAEGTALAVKELVPGAAGILRATGLNRAKV
jgi:hypothetical protein